MTVLRARALLPLSLLSGDDADDSNDDSDDNDSTNEYGKK